jgi:hypothetical protein
VVSGGFAATADGIVNDPKAIAALRAEVAELTDDVDLIATIGKGVLVGHRLVGRQPPGPKTTCSRSP